MSAASRRATWALQLRYSVPSYLKTRTVIRSPSIKSFRGEPYDHLLTQMVLTSAPSLTVGFLPPPVTPINRPLSRQVGILTRYHSRVAKTRLPNSTGESCDAGLRTCSL